MAPANFYVTTPIYYVNDKPHIGHAYTTILADVLARYHRLLDHPTHFLTGTDEHGQKVDDAAKKVGCSAQEQADQTVVRFQELWKRLGISHDDFIRTTEERHKKVVQSILQDLYDRGEIYEDEYEGWYSVSEERFYTEKELVNGKSPEGKAVEKITERNYFFKMSKYQEWLLEYIEENPKFIQPDSRKNEILGYLRKPLGDLCISRPKERLSWGIELPFDSDFICYVWFDALVNYISGVGYGVDSDKFAKWWPASLQLMGKDIIVTHAVYWTTMLKAMGVEMPQSIFAHGWWLVGDSKMSKSDGNAINPMDMIEDYGVDSLRYFLMAEMTLGSDATFTVEKFLLRYNADLANDLGNMTARVTKMMAKNFNGIVPKPGQLCAEGEKLRDACMVAVKEMEHHLLDMSLDKGIAKVIDAIREANRYFDKMAPWTLAKEGKQEELATVLYASAECLRIVSGLLFPVIPEKMSQLRKMLGIAESEIEPHLKSLSEWGVLEPGSQFGEIDILFPRVEIEKKEQAAPSKNSKGKNAKSNQPEVGLVDIETVFKTELRVAKVLEAKVAEDSDRLLLLQVDAGSEQRQIVAGVAKFYSPEELVGKLVVLVANLKPAKIRGLKSEGMLLAAKKGKKLKMLTIDGDMPPGSKIG